MTSEESTLNMDAKIEKLMRTRKASSEHCCEELARPGTER